jgi:1-pyrroline-5-carboxylate dehydrogenase
VSKARFANEFTYKSFLEGGREQEFDSLFESAAREVRQGFGRTYPLYIGGKPVNAAETVTERSPVDYGIVMGNFQKGTREHAQQAISAAQRAFPSWSAMGYRERAALFRKAADLFAKEKFRLAAILSYESAKSRYESIGEVDEAIDFIRYYASELEANKGFWRKTSMRKSRASVSEGFQGAPESATEKVSIALKPYGVFGVIAPFNFPVSISTGMSVGAMMAGNTVVFKPSLEKMTVLTGLKIYELFKSAGIPDGVFNYVTGPGSVIGAELSANDNVAGIAFTGSRGVGMGMLSNNFAAGKQKVFVVEMGGKNPAIVSKNADIDRAVSGVASAAFGFAGQKCSALSRLYVHESIKELFISKLIETLRTLKVGNPIEKANYIGPLIGESAYAMYLEAVQKARKEGRILYGGNRVNVGLQGYYVEPTLIEVMHNSELVHKELFVPILTVEGFKNLDDAIAMANDTEYGLTAGFYGKSKKEAKQFCDKIQAGVVYVNREVSATTGAIVGLHTFVGWKGSGLTGKGTGSKFYLQQFMREQSVSVTA